MEACKFCGCKGLWKAGVINGKQRYRCKSCAKNQAEVDDRVKYSYEERRQALVLYLEENRFHRIARIMEKLFRKEYRHQTIMHWIKIIGKREKNKSMDSVDKGKLRITAFEVGGGKSSVLRKLINKIGENNLKTVYTGGNFCYEEELYMNADIKHIVSKLDLLSGELQFSLKTLSCQVAQKNQVL